MRASACSSSRRRPASATTRSTRASPQSGRSGRPTSSGRRDRGRERFRDSVLAHYDTVVFLSTTGDPLNDGQQAAFERYIQRGRRLHRHPCSGRHRVRLELVRPPGGRLLPEPPARHARPRRSMSRTSRTARPRTCLRAGSARTSGTTTARRTSPIPMCRTATTARVRAASTCSPRWTRRRTTSRTATRPTTITRSRGATRTTAAAPGTPAWATRPRRTPSPTSSSICWAGSRSRPARRASAECTNEGPSVQAAADPQTGNAPLTVSLTSSGSDPEGQTLVYSWDFGDGGRAFGSVRDAHLPSSRAPTWRRSR